MKNFSEFIIEQSSKFFTVNYKIIIRDSKDNPTLLVTEFNIVKSEDNKIEIKAKGFINTYLDGYNDGKKKKGWFAFDDFKDDKTRIVWSKNFQNGTKKIKVYQ